MDDQQINDNFDNPDIISKESRPAHIEALMKVVSKVQEVQSYIYSAITSANLSPDKVIGNVSGLYDKAIDLIRESEDGKYVDENSVKQIAEEIAIANNDSLDRFESFAQNNNINLEEQHYTSNTPFGKIQDSWSPNKLNFEIALNSAKNVSKKLETLRAGTIEKSPSAYDASKMTAVNTSVNLNRPVISNNKSDGERFTGKARSEYYRNIIESEKKRDSGWSGRGSVSITSESKLTPNQTASQVKITDEIRNAKIEKQIISNGGYDPSRGSVDIQLAKRYGQKNALPKQASEKAEVNRFGALKDTESKRDANRASLAPASISKPSAATIINSEIDKAKDRNSLINSEKKRDANRATIKPQTTSKNKTELSNIVGKNPTPFNRIGGADVAEKKQQKKVTSSQAAYDKHIASGGTKEQVDTVAAIYASGDKKKIAAWERFVATKEAEKKATSAIAAKKSKTAAVAVNSRQQMINSALSGQSSFVQSRVRAEISKGNTSKISDLVKWFQGIEKSSAARVPTKIKRAESSRVTTPIATPKSSVRQISSGSRNSFM